MGEPKNGNEAYRGKYGSGLCLAEHLWVITSNEQLNTFSDNRLSGGIVNSSSKPGTEIGVVPLTGPTSERSSTTRVKRSV